MPVGLRKSGMPDSVDTPAPVNTTARAACSIMPRSRSMSSRASSIGNSYPAANWSKAASASAP